MKDQKSLLLKVDIPSGFTVEIEQEGFVIFRGSDRLAKVISIKAVRLALEYFAKQYIQTEEG